jgi:acyl-CoA synthetase (AMP-forming)/AMP-acid ligase II/thioesterase domain-containing protein/acyl carrier protein
MSDQTEMSYASPQTDEMRSARPTTIGAAIRARAAEQPDQPALIGSGFAPLSYRELKDLIDQARTALRGAGLGRNAQIAVAMPNGPHAALAIVAVACSAVSIPLNPRQTLREIETGFASLPPDAVLLLKGSDSVVRRVADRLGIRILEAIRPQDGNIGFKIEESEAGATAAAFNEIDEPDSGAPAFILQTSGTTAKPKLIPTAHRNMLASAARVQGWFDLRPQDRCLCVSPVFYAHGLHVTIFTPLLTGGSVAFPTEATKFDFTEWFGTLRPTWYSAGPTLHRLVFDQSQPRMDAKTGHTLRFVLSGGAPMPRDLIDGLKHTLGVPALEHYGSSEGMQICSNQLSPGHIKIGTCGIPSPGTIMITGDDGRLLPAGQQGEILVGGPSIVAGYLNAPAQTSAAFVDGWFRSGDIGSIDADGFLTLHGRKDDLVNRGGEKISPTEVDEALLRHPAVAEAAAFATPHARLGQDIAAAVVLRRGAAVTVTDLRRFLQDQLAAFKVPGQILIRNELPKGKTGKVLRRQLATFSESADAAEVTCIAPRPDGKTPIGLLIAQLTEVWERILKVSPLSIDDDFAEKGGDSLLAMDMLLEVERLTGKAVPTSILFEARTIRQLAEALFEQRIQPKSLITLNSDGELKPLFLFHGDYLGGTYSAKLANLLGPEQPLFVIPPHDIGEEPLMLPIETIAAERLPLVRSAQPKGPYRLSGYCLGGLVAFEVARLLKDAGEEVEIVGMIDTPTVSARPYVQRIVSALRWAGGSVARSAPFIWHKISQIDRPIQFSVTRRLSAMIGRLHRRFGRSRDGAPAPRMSALAESRLAEIFRFNTDDWPTSVEAMSIYKPNPLAVPIVYYAAEYGSEPWSRISSDIVNVRLSGSHNDAVQSAANLALIANDLKARLRASG